MAFSRLVNLSARAQTCRQVKHVSRQQIARSFATESNEPLVKTAFYDSHLKLGGKMVPFAGYALPVQYPDGVITNHVHVRTAAGLFDVSHMGQLRFHGKDRAKFIERVTLADMAALQPHQAQLSCITNEKGGIIDDCVITKRDNFIAMVVNGGCKHKDMAHFKQQIAESKLDVTMQYLEERMLLALQGPLAAEVLARLVSSPSAVPRPFMRDADVKVAGLDCTVTRCGYTGEDGFEISVHEKDAVKLFDRILENKEVLPAGLGVRDSLRLEAGLCLYGHDLNEDITPIEAGLNWVISKRRRAEGGFLGDAVIKKQLETGVSKKRVGFLVSGAPAREGAEIFDASGSNQIGVITSGTFSPILKKPIAMGYIASEHSKVDTPVKLKVRGKFNEGVVAKMPFVPTRYYKDTK